MFCLLLLFLFFAANNLAQIDGSSNEHLLEALEKSTENVSANEVRLPHIGEGKKNLEQLEKRREFVQKFMQNKAPLKPGDAEFIKMKKLFEESAHLYQIYPMIGKTEEVEYFNICDKLYTLLDSDIKEGNFELATKLKKWKKELINNFYGFKIDALKYTDEQIDDVLPTMTMAEKITSKIKTLLEYYDRVGKYNNLFNANKEHPFDFVEKLQHELSHEENKIFAHIFDKFEQRVFADMDSLLHLDEYKTTKTKAEILEKLKPKLLASAVLLTGICYANTFLNDPKVIYAPSDYVNKFFTFDRTRTRFLFSTYGLDGVKASKEAKRLMDFYEFYGTHNFLFPKKQASKEIGEFYWNYMRFYDDKLVKLADEMALGIAKFIDISDTTMYHLYNRRRPIDVVHWEIVRVFFDRTTPLCGIKKNDDPLDGEAPWEWAVFSTHKGFDPMPYAAKKAKMIEKRENNKKH